MPDENLPAYAISKAERKLVIYDLRRQAEAFAEQVAPIYKLLGWRWQKASTRQPDATEIPKYPRILKTLLGLIDSLESEDCLGVSTGGLSTWIERTESGELEAGMRFTVSEDYNAYR